MQWTLLNQTSTATNWWFARPERLGTSVSPHRIAQLEILLSVPPPLLLAIPDATASPLAGPSRSRSVLTALQSSTSWSGPSERAGEGAAA
jgi:hypothetical protein